MFLAVLIGMIISIILLGGWDFKDKCDLFELNIDRAKVDIVNDSDSNWNEFRQKAGIEASPPYLKSLWERIITGRYPANQIAVLRLTIHDLYK